MNHTIFGNGTGAQTRFKRKGRAASMLMVRVAASFAALIAVWSQCFLRQNLLSLCPRPGAGRLNITSGIRRQR